MNHELIRALEKEERLHASEKDCVIIYLVEVAYKSGNKKEFWCTDFEYKKNHGGISFTYKWITNLNRPLFLNVDEVESVWVKDQASICKEEYDDHKEVLAHLKDFFEPSGETK